jgi:PhnB protein
MTDPNAIDPLDALRRVSGPVAPRAQFADSLRRRVAAALADVVAVNPGSPTDPVAADPARSTVDLGERKDTAMSQTDLPAPVATSTRDPLVGVTGISPYLAVRDGVAALAFYAEAFGAVVDHEIVMPDGRLGHAQVTIGTGAMFQIADEFPEMGIVGPATLGNTSVAMTVVVPDADVTFARAVAAGATVEREMTDEFYGARSGTIKDPFGHRWHIQTPTETLTADEIRRRAQER